MYGKLIVIEGTDGSGKATQTELLCSRLAGASRAYTKLSFPRYDKPSSKLVSMYLAGDFGTAPSAVSPYEASKFYAIDRYASYKEDWEKLYKSGQLIIADRYTTSNAVHQSAKMPRAERREFFNWLNRVEYEVMGLPKPDKVFYLDMPLVLTARLMNEREVSSDRVSDIHEKDLAYLALCKEAALDAIEFFGWEAISCVDSAGSLRTLEAIHEDIYKNLCEIL